MKKALFVLPLVLFGAACQTSPNQSALTGAAAGAALGAAVSGDDDRVAGALIGGATGAAAGNYIGQSRQSGQCVYSDNYGRQYTAPC
ncbi:glycine zipper 2TM protein [Palleronia aestuarii]|uniref:17 kDa surface antigen n=1 Tax=Palleronia aestuarii TaxID=568105 RepID=A0A2W7NJD0_9RHOB|nr:glycine zipper 2TM domain-containing protein [Palleronia aestuarii]PZX11402.1 glycine zipper 2TM protein [Palleronia aestuarii]